MRNLLAFDIGASNGRAILGQFDGERISMRELHRFENHYVEMNGIYYWDLPYIYNQLKQGFLAFRRADIGALDCFGIDTWGVDYGLLDKMGISSQTPALTATPWRRTAPRHGRRWTSPRSSPIPA